MVKSAKFRFIIICFMMVALIAGCSKNNNAPTETLESTAAPQEETAAPDATTAPEVKGIVIDPEKKVKLRYYTNSGYDQVEFEAAYPDWQAKYPNIEVELVLVSSGDFDTSVKMATIAGEQMDVIATGTADLERANPDTLYIPLDDFVARDGWDLKAEYGGYADQFVVDGKLYSIPSVDDCVPCAVLAFDYQDETINPGQNLWGSFPTFHLDRTVHPL